MNISAEKYSRASSSGPSPDSSPDPSPDILNNIDWPRIRNMVARFDEQTRAAAREAADHLRRINRAKAPSGSEAKPWKEKREYPRNRVGMYVGLTCGRMNGYHRARDMSLTGIFIETAHRIAPGEEVLLSIPFTNQDRHVDMKGRVVRVTEDGIGIRFDPFDIAIGQ